MEYNQTSACSEIIDDIEDLISSQDITPKERYANKKDVTVRAKKRKQIQIENEKEKEKECEIENQANRPVLESVIPGTQKVYVKTWGCAHNNSDSEYMAGQLAAYGYNLTGEKELADLWLLNSCTVKNPSEDTFRNEIQTGLNIGKHVVVAGCVPQGAPKSDYLKGLSIVGVRQIDRIVEVVEETLKGHTVRLLQTKKVNGKQMAGAPLDLPKIRKNPLIEIIAINTGCLNQCTYCKTKHSRGNLTSYPPEEIVARAVQAFEQGVCEIWLTSEDTGTYGRDIGTSLPELLWKLVDVIPDGCMLRVGMTNPPYILEHLKEIAKIFQTPRVYSFLHVPVQSGSDSVLGEMKREYCRKDFEKVVDTLRDKVSGITIATDIICGFPTETESDFDETMTLCAKYEFPSLFINQFYPRPGTPAAQMKRIPANLVKTRTKRLTDLFNSYEPYSDRCGKEYTVLVTDISHDKQHYVSHNKFYEQILLPMKENLLGKSVCVRITAVTKFSMIGELLQDENEWRAVSTNTENVHEQISRAALTSTETNGIVTNCSSENDTKQNVLFYYALIAVALALIYRYFWKLLKEYVV